MMKTGSEVRVPVAAARARFRFSALRLSGLIILALLVTLGTLRAEEPSEQYLRIYNLMTQADNLSASNEVAAARAKYEAAQAELKDLKRTFPTWNPKLVTYRLGYLADRIAALSQPASAPTAKATPTNQPVQLLEAGTEPRRVLRLHPHGGETQSLTLTMKDTMDMRVGSAGGQAIQMPAVTMPMDMTIENVSSNGDIAYRMVMGEPDMALPTGSEPQMAEAMKSSLAALKGLSSTGTISDRGMTKASEMKLPLGADPQVRQTMDQMKEALSSFFVMLPEAAVGPGARWEIKQPLVSQGMKIDQTLTYELVSVEGDQFKAKVTLTQRAANQKMENPSMPGMKIDVTRMTGNGSGNLSFDLAHVMPTQGTIDTHSEVSMQLDAGGRKQAMQMKVDSNIRLESK